MSSEEIEDFLNERYVARIATIKPNGSPHVTPVWYLWKNKQLLISIGEDSVKVKNVLKNNRVAVTIDNCTYPGMGVIIEGKAEIRELSETIEWEIGIRYLESKILIEYLKYAHATWKNVLLIVHPEKIISWDSSKEPIIRNLFT